MATRQTGLHQLSSDKSGTMVCDIWLHSTSDWKPVSFQNRYPTISWTQTNSRDLHGSAPPYLGPLVPVCSLPSRLLLRSTSIKHLLVPPVKQSTVGSCAFPVADPKTWNALPESVTSSQSE